MRRIVSLNSDSYCLLVCDKFVKRPLKLEKSYLNDVTRTWKYVTYRCPYPGASHILRSDFPMQYPVCLLFVVALRMFTRGIDIRIDTVWSN